MGYRSKLRILNKGISNVWETLKELFIILSHQVNADQNDSDSTFHLLSQWSILNRCSEWEKIYKKSETQLVCRKQIASLDQEARNEVIWALRRIFASGYYGCWYWIITNSMEHSGQEARLCLETAEKQVLWSHC